MSSQTTTNAAAVPESATQCSKKQEDAMKEVPDIEKSQTEIEDTQARSEDSADEDEHFGDGSDWEGRGKNQGHTATASAGGSTKVKDGKPVKNSK